MEGRKDKKMEENITKNMKTIFKINKINIYHWIKLFEKSEIGYFLNMIKNTVSSH